MEWYLVNFFSKLAYEEFWKMNLCELLFVLVPGGGAARCNRGTGGLPLLICDFFV